MTAYPPRPGEVDQIVRRAARVRLWHAAAAGLATSLVSAVVLVPNISGGGVTGLEPTRPGPASAPPSARAAVTQPPVGPQRGTPPGTAPSARPGGPLALPSASGQAPVSPATPGTTPATTPGTRCAAGQNGGATDDGVTETSARLFTTLTHSGIAASGGDHRAALSAQVDRANRGGGVCGRRLILRTVDDGGDAARGADLARRAFEEGVVAVPFAGAPSVLARLLADGDLARTRTPVVVGTGDAAFYGHDWVWPVGVRDGTAARLMVRDAYRRGARTFGVVFDDAALGAAFDAEVRRLTGRHVAGHTTAGQACQQHYCGPERDGTSPRAFYADPPDFVGLLLDVEPALRWQQDAFTRPVGDLRHGAAGLDRLLAYHLRSQCGERCDGLRVWSAYKARCGAYATDPAVRQYIDDLDGTSADSTDPAVAATYAAAQLLIEAVRAAGPALTGDRLADVLRTARLRAGLTVAGTVSFAAGGNRTMRAYDLHYAGTPQTCTLGPVARA